MKTIRMAAALAATLTLIFSCGEHDRYVAIQGYAQGGTYSVKVNLRGRDGMIRKSPEALKEAIDSILNDIDTSLSGYNKGSLLSRFNAGRRIRPDKMFTDVYGLAYSYYEETGGALDAASGPLFDLWGFGFTRDSLPSDESVRAVMSRCGMGRLERDLTGRTDADGTISAEDLLTGDAASDAGDGDFPAAVLNFNAIAQGYSCDVVASYLYRLGVKDMLVDIGEIFCDGVNPEGKPWKVGVDRPFDGNDAPGSDLDGIWQSDGSPCGIVTSGNYRKFYIRDGKKYAHTIDPRSGYPVQHNLLSATIVARNATDADAYATYCMVIGLEEAKKFIESRKGELSGYLIWSDETGTMHEWASKGFNLIK